MSYRDRVVGLAWLPPAQVRPAPLNWRTHGAEQLRALKGLLAEVGVAGAQLVWVPGDEDRAALVAGGREGFAAWLAARPGVVVQLVDGHARRNVAGKQALPALVTVR